MIPSMKAVLARDIVFSGTHFVVPKMHDEWIQTLDQIAALHPNILIVGYPNLGLGTLLNSESQAAFPAPAK
jgi:hypothetical protein